MEHTRGPWNYYESGDGTLAIESTGFNDPEGGAICTLAHFEDYSRATADARLMSAAPDLLDACRLAMAVIDAVYTENPHGVSPATRAALFDALGPMQKALNKANGRR